MYKTYLCQWSMCWGTVNYPASKPYSALKVKISTLNPVLNKSAANVVAEATLLHWPDQVKPMNPAIQLLYFILCVCVILYCMLDFFYSVVL